jgi:hypothetical protein
MKKATLIVALLVYSLNLYAQAPSWAWAKSLAGARFDCSAYPSVLSSPTKQLTTDINGNIIIVGILYSPSITLGSITLTNSSGVNNLIIVKYDQNGKVIWAKSADSSMATAVTTDANANIIVAGHFDGNISFGSTTLSGGGGFMVKYDPNGNIIWAKKTTSQYCHDLCTDAVGNIVWNSYDSKGLIKFDPNGNIIWTTPISGYSLSIDMIGNILLTGEFRSSTISFGTITLTNSGGSDMFIVKYDPNGNVLWAKSSTGNRDECPKAVTTDGNGNILITGDFNSSFMDFGGSSTPLTNNGAYDIFVVKYDSTGSVLWTKSSYSKSCTSYQDETTTSITTDASGNLFISGTTYGNINFGSITLPVSSGCKIDLFIVKYDTNGNVIWGITKGGIYNDQVYHLTSDATGNIIIAGKFGDTTITFGTTTLTNTTFSSSGGSDNFIAKLSSATGIAIHSKDAAMLVSPNPFNNSTLIQLPKSVNNAEIIVSDLLGKKVTAKKFSGKEYLLEKGNMSPGIYFVQINDGQHQYPITKIVVQ